MKISKKFTNYPHENQVPATPFVMFRTDPDKKVITIAFNSKNETIWATMNPDEAKKLASDLLKFSE